MVGVNGNPGSNPWLMFGLALLFGVIGVMSRKTIQSLSNSAALASRNTDAMRTEVERQRDLVDALADGLEIAVLICDARARILYSNERARTFFKVDNPVDKSVLAASLNYDLERLVLEAFRQREAQSAELSFSYPEEKVGLAKAWPSDIDSERIFLTIYEVTELRRLERVRQVFVSNVSHEFRTPLTIIRSMAETLLDDPTPDPELAAKYLPRIISEVDRLAMISNDLLILSAAESNPVRKQICDIAELFKSVLDQLIPKARERGLETSFEGQDHLEIEANQVQMTQVAINLIDNAINYSNKGRVGVSVKTDSDFAEIEVSDQGLGIASEHLPRIFERFYRVDKARARASAGGTGLGLSIVKHIVESHGGEVTVDSALNEGSTFRVRLPIGDIRLGSEQNE
jgi:two-component system, OmpR family, phosphate regulon sensor histidine kinase PhoR